MKGRRLSAGLAHLVAASLVLFTGTAQAQSSAMRFSSVDVVIDSGDAPLATYQFELSYDQNASSLVGIEGGDPPYQRAPYYDPKGLTAGRVVIADFSTGKSPPRGRIHVARIHLEKRGEPNLRARLMVAGTTDGSKVTATISLVPLEGGERK